MRDATVAVVGLGLIGGSLARDLAARGARVLGYDHNPGALQAAVEAGVLHAALGPDLAGADDADAVVIAVPVSAAPEVLAALRPRIERATLITDVGSTKRGIVAAARRLGLGRRFVGGHPLAGDHRAGWPASRAGLFRGARVFLCPSADSAPVAVRLARGLWRDLGATVEIITPEAHDRRMAYVSHLPQLASSLMAVLLDRQGFTPAHLGPGGRDALRLAAGSPDVWTAILLENGDRLEEALVGLEESLALTREALDRRDRARLYRLLVTAREWSRSGAAG